MMDKLIKILNGGCHSLVVSNGETHIYDGRGVSDLYRLLNEEPEVLYGALVADKIVGKGAAALIAIGKPHAVYAEVISAPAYELLQRCGIDTCYGKLVAYIENRQGTGQCPLEMRCKDCLTPEECLLEISAFIEEMKKNNNK